MLSIRRHYETICSRHIRVFFFNDPATTEIYTLSLHDALPIFSEGAVAVERVIRPRLRAVLRILHRRFHTTKDRKSTRLNSSHVRISYAVFCLKKKKNKNKNLHKIKKKNTKI